MKHQALEQLLRTLKTRFEGNLHRQQGVEWAQVQAKLDAAPAALRARYEMEATGGEPDVTIIVFPIPLPIPAPLFALLYLGFTWYAARRPARGRVNHDAHLSGAVAGVLFVLATDPAAFGRALQQVFG